MFCTSPTHPSCLVVYYKLHSVVFFCIEVPRYFHTHPPNYSLRPVDLFRAQVHE